MRSPRFARDDRKAAFQKTLVIVLSLILISGASSAQELPIPSSKNAVVISIEHSPTDGPEVDYIKKNFDFGLYAWLSFSVTALPVAVPWHSSPVTVDSGIADFKTKGNELVLAAKRKGVRLHLVLTSGLARGLAIYKDAKVEDIRNAQWYNDNKLAADDQISDPAAMETYVFGTFSRYARKMRANLEAKARAAMRFLKQVMVDNPETLVAISGWGEAEMNKGRLNNKQNLQDYFCDYSPFAVLEFRDWIRHTGEYDDATGKYKGQGFRDGPKYKGAAGLALFNTDFGTDFKTWSLKYYDWSLLDDYDAQPEDSANNDPHRIPLSSYSHGKMMPASGPNFIAGGFDPPRNMTRADKFLNLWGEFRETLVANFARDAARWASESGITSDHWFSHQIPADCLFGSDPDAPIKNPRYYSSASPISTADVTPFGSPGATIYDQKFPPDIFPPVFARTTDHALPAISSMSPVWAIMEYDPEGYLPGHDVPQSSPEFILDQYMRVYEAGPTLINFWRWRDVTEEHTIKGMNKEIALRSFIRRIRDRARSKDLSVVFAPPRVTGVEATFLSSPPAVEVKMSPKIWEGQPWEWKVWGDFGGFEIFRGAEPGFPADAAHLVAKTKDDSFTDTAVSPRQIYFYKVRAMNSKETPGPFSAEIKVASGPADRNLE